MEVEIKPNRERAEIELKITVPADEFEPYIKEAAKKLAAEKAIKGFRPGKAPARVVEEVFGWGRLLNEAVEGAVPRLFVTAVLENELDVIARPKIAIDEAGRDKGLKFTATAEVLPEVTLGNLSQIEVEKRIIEVTDEDVAGELMRLAKMRSSYIDVARPAVEGDTVVVDFKISQSGVIMEGGQGSDHPVHLGEGAFVPDFENKLIGMAAGDVREFKIKFPAETKKNNLAGQEADAWVKAKVVQKRVVPEINDAWAKQLGDFADLVSLKQRLKDNLRREREHREEERRRSAMTEKLAEGATFSQIPGALIDKEIDRLVEEFERMMAWQQKTIKDYLQEKNRTMEQVREEMRPTAEKNVRVGLALRTFARQEDITVEEEEVEDKARDYLQRFASAKEATDKIDPDELREHLTYLIRNQKAMEMLESKVTVKEVRK